MSRLILRHSFDDLEPGRIRRAAYQIRKRSPIGSDTILLMIERAGLDSRSDTSGR